MTSLDMNGISLSLSACGKEQNNPLAGKCGAPAWPELNPVVRDDFLIAVDLPED
jgi:hypothetical protein